MELFETTTMDIEEAYKEAEEALKATRDQIEFKVEKETKLTSTIYHVSARININYPLKGLEYLKSILDALNINAMVEMRKKPTGDVKYVITSEENSLLIGKGGKTLEAIQILIRQVVNQDQEEEKYHVTVDCGGYKEQRLHQLEVLATKTAKEVTQTKVEAHLYPMNSFERRIIHSKLSDWRDVYTESEGEDKERHIVIKPRNK